MKHLKSITLFILLSILLVSCNIQYEKNIDEFCKILLDPDTYTNAEEDNLDEFILNFENKFEDIVSQNALDSLYKNRIPMKFYNIMNYENFEDISNLKITKLNENKNETDNYINTEYELSYELLINKNIIEMKDYLIIKLDNNYPYEIKEVNISSDSSIFEEIIPNTNK